jgi:pimeloyl-ACP methyl ester carboxylesterase
MASLKQHVIQLYARKRFGGQTAEVKLADRAIPTQSFNTAAPGGAKAAIVFLPGFGSVPQLAAPGELGAAARELNLDFVRFTHPDLLSNPARLTYPRMIEDAAAVIQQLPHKKVVLAASSFGAGMMRFVADRVNERQPGKVAGMFGWAPVTTEALTELFAAQSGWAAFANGETNKLQVRSPTMPKPFTMSRAQADSVLALNGQPTAPFRGVALLYAGTDDPVGRTEFSVMAASQINETKPPLVRILDCGHRLPPGKIKRGVTSVVMASF